MTITEAMTPQEASVDDQLSKFYLSVKLGFFTLLNGRKWVLYLVIAGFPLLISWITQDYLFGNTDAESAIIDVYVAFFWILMFTFGTMLTSLPVSSDEITDKIVDLYLVRPVRRDVYWTSRWVVVNMGVFVINFAIVTFYWIYFNLVDNGFSGIGTSVVNIFGDSWTYFRILGLVAIATYTYSAIFLFVGSIGNRGFTLGILIATTETFLVSLLFLQGSEYIPRTHLNNFAYEFFKDDHFTNVDGLKGDFSTMYGATYLFLFGLLTYLIGMYFFKRKELV